MVKLFCSRVVSLEKYKNKRSQVFLTKFKLACAIRFFSSLNTLSPHFYRGSKGLVFARKSTKFLKGSRKKRKYPLRNLFNRISSFKNQRRVKKSRALKKSFKSLKLFVVKSYKVKKLLGTKKVRGKTKGLTASRTFLFRRVQRKFKLTSLFVQKFKKKALGFSQKGYRSRKYFLKRRTLNKVLTFSKKKQDSFEFSNKWKRYPFFKLKLKFRRMLGKIRSRVGFSARFCGLSRIRFALPPQRGRDKRGGRQKRVSQSFKGKAFRPYTTYTKKFYAFRSWKWRFPRWSYKWRNFSRLKKGSPFWREHSKWSLLNFFPNRITRRPKQPKRVRTPIRMKRSKAIAYLRSRGEGTEAKRTLSIFSDRIQIALAYKKIHKGFYGNAFPDLIKSYYIKARRKDSRVLSWQNSLLGFLENRLDVILLRSRLVPHIEMSRWLIRKGYVFCNGKQTLNPSCNIDPLVFVNLAHQSFIDLFRYWLLRDRYHRHLFRCRGFRFDSIYQHPNSEVFAMVLKKSNWSSVPRRDRLDFYQLNRLLLAKL